MASKSDTAKNIVLICGSDEFRVSEEARKLVDAWCPPADQAFGLERIEGDAETLDAVAGLLRRTLGALQTVGFLGQPRTVWLRNATFLGDAEKMGHEMVKPTMDLLVEECRKGLVSGNRFLISSGSVDRRLSGFKAWAAVADVRTYDVPAKAQEAAEDARDFVAELLDRQGLRAGPDVVEALLARCADRRSAAMEVEKLALYTMGRPSVTRADVDAVVSSSRETASWDLADAFGRGDLAEALQVLRRLLFQKESPHGLLAGIESRIRDLLMARECVQRRWAVLSGSGKWQKLTWQAPPEGAALLSAFDKDPRKWNEWRGGILAQQAARFPMERLLACHRLAVETHEAMVSSPVPAEALLELFLIKALGRPAHANA